MSSKTWTLKKDGKKVRWHGTHVKHVVENSTNNESDAHEIMVGINAVSVVTES